MRAEVENKEVLDLDFSDLDEAIEIEGEEISLSGEEANEIDESVETLRKSVEEAYSTPVPKKEEKEDKPSALEIKEETFFTGTSDDLEDLTRDPKAFNALLNSIYKKATEQGHSLAIESFMKSAPQIMKTQVAHHVAMKGAIDNFYAENEDLVPYKKVVAGLATKIAAANPELTFPKLLKATEQVARKKLSLMKKTEEGDKNKGPKFPRTPSGKRVGSKSELSGMAKEIEEMEKALGG